MEKIRRRAIVEMKGAGTLVQDAQAEHTVEGSTEEEEAGDVEEAEAEAGAEVEAEAVLVALTTNNFKRTL